MEKLDNIGDGELHTEEHGALEDATLGLARWMTGATEHETRFRVRDGISATCPFHLPWILQECHGGTALRTFAVGTDDVFPKKELGTRPLIAIFTL